MAGYSMRSLAQLAAEAKGAFVQAVQGTSTKLLPNVWRVESKVLALLGFEMEQRRAWLVRQLFASTADEVWLRRHGFELGLTRAPASAALGKIVVEATPGLVVPSGLQFSRDDGVTFTTLVGATAFGSSATLTLQADEAAEDGNTAAGAALTLVDVGNAPAGLSQSATVDAAGLGGGADPEPLERFRARVLARKRQPPQGGSALDYVTWAREALAAVDRVFVDCFQNDARSVWVCFTVTDQPNGIPTAAQVAVVQDYVNDPVRRPVTARAFATGPLPGDVNVLIGGLSPDTPDIRDAIATELAAVFVDRAEPGTPSADFVLSASWIHEAVSRATGEDRHRLVTPAADLTFTAGVLPVLGVIDYTD